MKHNRDKKLVATGSTARVRVSARAVQYGIPSQQLTIRSLEAAQTTATDLTWEQVPCIIYLPILPA